VTLSFTVRVSLRPLILPHLCPPLSLPCAQGDRVGLYGSIGVQGGPYTVRVDNGSVSNFTSKRRIADPNTSLADYLAGQMLFHADGLVAGNHTLTVTSNLGSLGIDYAIIDGTLKPSPTNPSNPAGKRWVPVCCSEMA
jgi:hypothetical protein